MRIRPARQRGFTLVEIMVVVAIIGLLASIAIPNFVKARTHQWHIPTSTNFRSEVEKA